MNEPKLIFENAEELQTYAKEWQTRLFLDDWTIKFQTMPHDKQNSYHGLCEYQFTHKRALITIYNNIPSGEYVSKLCDEKTLIHELLHCKFINLDNGTLEGKIMDEYQHQLLEEIAKSLLMAKYNISFNWFNPDNNN